MKKNAPPREERGRRSSTEANPHPASDRLHRRRRNPLEHKQGANRFQPVRTQTIHEGQFTEPKPSKPLRPLGASHLLESVPHLADDNIHNPLKKNKKNRETTETAEAPTTQLESKQQTPQPFFGLQRHKITWTSCR